MTERSFAKTGPKTWNQIPQSMRQIESHNEFKGEIKKINFSKVPSLLEYANVYALFLI